MLSAHSFLVLSSLTTDNWTYREPSEAAVSNFAFMFLCLHLHFLITIIYGGMAIFALRTLLAFRKIPTPKDPCQQETHRSIALQYQRVVVHASALLIVSLLSKFLYPLTLAPLHLFANVFLLYQHYKFSLRTHQRIQYMLLTSQKYEDS